MPLLIKRPYLSCFYCGTRSQFLKDGNTRVFDCKSCEATNFLDRNGDITDIPATPTVAQPAVFAHTRRPSQSTTGNLNEKSLFCEKCLRNQHILVSCLADYLPPEDHPKYPEYEAQYPEYLKDLRRRYPQVCAKCAPKVQDRIRKSGYAAKVDFLTRSLEQSKSAYHTNHQLWNNIKIFALGLTSWAWLLSVAVQLWWHALGVLGSYDNGRNTIRSGPLDVVWCIMGVFSTQSCRQLAARLVSKSLLVSLCAIWWNPTLRDRYTFPKKPHQPTNLKDFYWFQALTLMLRTAFWLGLAPETGSDDGSVRGLHFVALLFIAFSTVGSYRMIKYTHAPKVSFKDSTGPLVEEGDFQYPTDDFLSKASTQSPGSYLVPQSKTPERKPFSISSLAPNSQRVSPAKIPSFTSMLTNSSSALPPQQEEDPADSMDWEPILQPPPHRHPSLNFEITPNTPIIPTFARPSAPTTTTTKSPFTTRVPAAPRGPAARILNPQPSPQFRPAPLSKQTDFFARMGLSTTSALPPTTTPKSRFTTEAQGDQENQTYVASTAKNEQDFFRPAQWTLKSDLDAANRGTGLEDMFTRSFTLGEEENREEGDAGTKGGHVFEVGRQGGQQREQAEEIVGTTFGVVWWPLALAVAALLIAVLREPLGRAWVWGLFSGDGGAVQREVGWDY